MLESIREFLIKINPDIIIQAPSRINLINPLDAVEGDFWMPSVAINGENNPLSAFLYIKNINTESRVKLYSIREKHQNYDFEIIKEEILPKNENNIKKKITGEFKLIYASINRLLEINSCFNHDFLNSNVELGFFTTIPKQSGLGGSTAIIIATIYGLAKYFNIYNNLTKLRENEFPINKDTIAEIATKIEDEDLQITAGYADRYVISRGGLCFCSYCGKLNHKNLSMEPLAVYDRIDKVYGINTLPIIVCFSGVFHKSGDVHSRLRNLYLKKDPRIINGYIKLAEISWKSRFAIMKQDWKLLGKYFKKNTKIMNQIMINAGFEYGIGLANNILIRVIEEHPEVYAAKLTGAGGGGSVFALVNPDKKQEILNYWERRLNEIIENNEIFSSIFPNLPSNIRSKLKNAKFYIIKIDKDGVKRL
ncbi:MAG: mevalonate kinase [Candidatus Hodarchaeota archaeon]